MPLSAALINPLLYVCRLMFSLQRDLRWWGSATLSYRAFRQPSAPSSCVSKDVLFVFSADGPNQRVCPDVFWGDPSTEGAGEMMHTPAAYKGEHLSRSVSFDAQETGASAFTCLLRLQCHPRVPEKSGADVLALGNLLYCFGRSVVVWCELRGPLPLVRSRKRTEEGAGTELRLSFTIPQKCCSCRNVDISFLIPPEFLCLDS